MKQNLQDEMFEVMLRNAFQDHREEDLLTEEELRAQGVEPHQFSPEFERKTEKLIKRTGRKQWRETHRKGLRHLAAMLAVVFLTGGILITQVDALRVPIGNLIITIGERFSEIKADDSEQRTVLSEKFDSRLPTYMPEGYFVESVEEGKDDCTVFYRNDSDGYYSVLYYANVVDAAIDTENAEIFEQEIRGQSAVISEKNGKTIIVWYPNGHEYIIEGKISIDEMIFILESIENIF